jgi:hypothetical protein
VRTRQEAIEMLYTLLSIHNWELLIMERGWSPQQYIDWMNTVSKRTFVESRLKLENTRKGAM